MVLSRPDGSLEYVNPALLRMLGYNTDEIYSTDIVISHPAEAALNAKIRKSLLKDPFTPVVTEKRYIHKDGTTIFGMLTIVAQADDCGNVERYIAQVIDLTQQKQTEQKLNLFSYLLEQTNDAVFVIELETGRLLNVNYSACKNLGYRASELVNMSVKDIEQTIPNDAAWQAHITFMRRERQALLEGQHRCKDSYFALFVSIKKIHPDFIFRSPGFC